jgi:hypothetical protein
MSRFIILLIFAIGIAFQSNAQHVDLDTLGITNGSVHIRGSMPYTKFLKKYKGDNDLTVHIWYNPTSSSLGKKEIKAGLDEVYFLYGRNLRTGLSEMDFVFGSNATQAFSKKKLDELTELVDFIEFEVFANQNFNGEKALEILQSTLE